MVKPTPTFIFVSPQNGEPATDCGLQVTGYFRDGFCRTASHDTGTHVIAAVVTDEFLQYSRAQGNDLITPHPPSFPGCGGRWVPQAPCTALLQGRCLDSSVIDHAVHSIPCRSVRLAVVTASIKYEPMAQSVTVP